MLERVADFLSFYQNSNYCYNRLNVIFLNQKTKHLSLFPSFPVINWISLVSGLLFGPSKIIHLAFLNSVMDVFHKQNICPVLYCYAIITAIILLFVKKKKCLQEWSGNPMWHFSFSHDALLSLQNVLLFSDLDTFSRHTHTQGDDNGTSLSSACYKYQCAYLHWGNLTSPSGPLFKLWRLELCYCPTATFNVQKSYLALPPIFLAH